MIHVIDATNDHKYTLEVFSKKADAIDYAETAIKREYAKHNQILKLVIYDNFKRFKDIEITLNNGTISHK